MTYEYRVLPYPEVLEDRNQMIPHLEEMIAEGAVKGWEFYRIDAIGVDIAQPKGCAAFFATPKSRREHMHIVTFRRETQ